jgi:hypothetical protein
VGIVSLLLLTGAFNLVAGIKPTTTARSVARARPFREAREELAVAA